MLSDSLPLPHLKKVRPEDRLLFLCARQQFLTQHRQLVLQVAVDTKLSWDHIYTTALSHGVGPLVGSNLQQCPELEPYMDERIKASFDSCIQKSKVLKGLFAERAHEVLEFFAKRSIPVMLIKGAALDVLIYDKPWFVHSGDIDLIVGSPRVSLPPDDRKALDDLVHARSLPNRIVPLECEWHGHHDVSMNEVLYVDFKAIWERASLKELYGSRASVMCREDLLLAACVNACRKRYFRLKSLCDIAELLRTYDYDWDSLVGRAKEWKCNWIVHTALLVTAMTLGCRLPDGTLDTLHVPPLRRRLIDFLCSHMSFTTLGALNKGSTLLGRRVSAGLLLPYATLGGVQLFKSLRELLRT